ncbi:DUF6867 family protein [Hyphomicrobium sp. CS1GBMeth3]|uniref:DUF6867 family protein n=1 Tax=Hyphomicrobium sp. CS1GBMeth3 TaxID=1892845 RepID=UPI0009302C57|nr:hypothetical protein [Hyphomicrobium sp. CS1GBMeth3]
MLDTVLSALGYADEGGNTFWHFVLLTLLIGGGAAWRTGQAVAQGWGPIWPVAAYTALLAAAIRFLHYALFGGTLLSLPSYLVDLAILLVVALVAYRARRTRHMTEQYPWVFERSGPLTWRERS